MPVSIPVDSSWIKNNPDLSSKAVLLSVPQLGNQVLIQIETIVFNLGPCIMASYEDGSGRNFIVRTPRMEDSMFFKLKVGIATGFNPFKA